MRDAEAGDLGDVTERGPRQERARWRQRREGTHAIYRLVHVDGDAEAIAFRAEVADHQAHWADFALDVDVPALHPSWLEVRIDRVWRLAGSGRGVECAVQPDVPGHLEWRRQRGIGRQGRHRIRRRLIH